METQKCNECGYVYEFSGHPSRVRCPLCQAKFTKAAESKSIRLNEINDCMSEKVDWTLSDSHSLEYWKKRCELAEDVINKSQLTKSNQIRAYNKWLEFTARADLNEPETLEKTFNEIFESSFEQNFMKGNHRAKYPFDKEYCECNISEPELNVENIGFCRKCGKDFNSKEE